MKYTPELKQSLKQAEKLLSDRQRAQQGLTEAEGQLREALGQHADAEARYEKAAAESIVNGGAEPPKAELDAALKRVSDLTAVSNGLKRYLADQETALQAALADLTPQLDTFYQQVESEFAVRYHRTADEMAALLGERARLEAVMGRPINVAAPIPTDGVRINSDIAAPGEARRQLADALAGIANQQRETELWAKRRPGVTATASRYRVIRPFAAGSKTFAVGDVIAGSELEPGAIALYAEQRRIIPLAS
jgi:hypothetical protein